jgi:Carboxypeptidase regulatory-like domain
LGKVTAIKHAQATPGNPGPALSMNMGGTVENVEFTIEEPYLGVAGRTVEVTTNSSEASCGYGFVEGERYVVYAYKNQTGELLVSLCSRTRPAKYAEEDISYFRALSTFPTTATVEGSVWRYTHDPNFKPKFRRSIMDHYRPPEQEYMAMEPVPGMRIVATAKDGTAQTTTVDPKGEWKITGLAPGPYVIEVGATDSTFVYPFRSKIDIAARGCARVDIRVESNGRVSGEFKHPKPDSDWALLKIFALPVDKPDLRHPTIEDDINMEESVFQLGPLPPGRYVVGVYLVKQIAVGTDGHTFRDMAPTYFPGVTDLHAAIPVEVPEGKSVRGLNFTMRNTEFLPELWRCEICDKK